MLQNNIDLYQSFDFQSNFIFKNLDKGDLVKMDGVSERIHFSKGDKLFYEDGVPTGVFLIEKGKAKKYKTVIEGQHQIFYIYTQGELLGYHALLSQERYHDSCEALEGLDVKFISKDNFFQLMDEIPQLKQGVIRNMAHEFGVLANTIAILAQKSQNVRLALYLLVLEHRFNRKKKLSDGIDLNRQDMANLIGATRESLGRSLKEFRDMGWIDIRSKNIHIMDEAALFRLIS